MSRTLKILILLLIPAFVHAASVFDSISDEVKKVFDSVAPAVVKVRSEDSVQPLAGTGFFIDNKGTILTSAAIIGEDYKVSVEYQGRKMEALVLSKDPRSGIALLRIEANGTPFLEIGDSDTLHVASQVIGIAYPYNLPASPAIGMVSGFDVQYLNRFFATTHLRANMSISPGQIGGPILNSQGKVVGMLVMAIDEGKSCYAIPSNAASKIISDMIQYGEARHGWVGVGVIQDEPKGAGTPAIVKVSNLFEGTPAAKSGIEPGDEVIKIGTRDIKKPSDILDAAFFSKIGEKISVLVKRDGKKKTFEFTVQERPVQSKPVQSIEPIPTMTLPNRDEKPIQVKATR